MRVLILIFCAQLCAAQDISAVVCVPGSPCTYRRIKLDGLKLTGNPADLTQPIRLSVDDGTFSVSRYGSLDAAQAAIPAGGGVLNADVSVVIPGSFNLRSNVALICQPGVSIRSTGNVAVIWNANTDNTAVSSCSIRGGSAGISGYNASSFQIRNDDITGWSYRGIDIGKNSPDLSIIENRVHDGVPGCTDGVFFQDVGSGFDYERNYLNSTGCKDHGMAVHTFSSGGTAPGAKIADSEFVHDGPNFLLEIGQFGGARIPSPMIRDNRFRMLGPGAGAMSFQGVDSASTSGNIIDLGGQAPTIAAIEAVDALNPSIKEETVTGGGPGARALSIDSTSGAHAISNQLGGYVVIGNSGTFAGVTRLNNNTLQLNQITIPAGSTYPAAVLMQCNVLLCDGSGLRIEFNTMTGPQNTIMLEQDKGSISGAIVRGNSGAVLQVGAGVTGTVTQ